MKRTGVYGIRNKVNRKLYIGSSVDIDHRFTQHIFKLTQGTHTNYKLQIDYVKHGPDAFDFLVIEHIEEPISRDDLYKLEQKWMDATSNKYNIQKEAKPAARVRRKSKPLREGEQRNKRRFSKGRIAKAFRNLY